MTALDQQYAPTQQFPMPLQVRQVSIARGARMVIHALSLQVERQQILGLVGPNGSGKSTLLRSIAGLIPPSLGHIQLSGFDVQTHPMQAKTALGFAPDPAALPPGLSVRQVLQLCAIARQQNAFAEIPNASLSQAEKLGLMRYFDSFISTLSLGSVQKIAILIALMDAPSCIILDEVFNGLDPKSSHQLKAMLRDLRDQGCAIVLATHGLELAADLLDQMVLLEEGRIKASWDQVQFSSIRDRGGSGLEEAIVAALDGLAGAS
jgi:ABC-2 type transport system ATP-binding protein